MFDNRLTRVYYQQKVQTERLIAGVVALIALGMLGLIVSIRVSCDFKKSNNTRDIVLQGTVAAFVLVYFILLFFVNLDVVFFPPRGTRVSVVKKRLTYVELIVLASTACLALVYVVGAWATILGLSQSENSCQNYDLYRVGLGIQWFFLLVAYTVRRYSGFWPTLTHIWNYIHKTHIEEYEDQELDPLLAIIQD